MGTPGLPVAAVALAVSTMTDTLDSVIETLAARFPPERADRPAAAAVALILFEDPNGVPSALFIERRRRRGDRWSGDVALPGGMATHRMESAAEVARRETLEEIGLDPGPAVATLPRRYTLHPRRTRPMAVVPVVFRLDQAPDLERLMVDPREVASVFTVPLSRLLERPGIVRKRVAGRRVPVPAIRLPEERVLWGLTLSMTRAVNVARARLE